MLRPGPAVGQREDRRLRQHLQRDDVHQPAHSILAHPVAAERTTDGYVDERLDAGLVAEIRGCRESGRHSGRYERSHEPEQKTARSSQEDVLPKARCAFDDACRRSKVLEFVGRVEAHGVDPVLQGDHRRIPWRRTVGRTHVVWRRYGAQLNELASQILELFRLFLLLRRIDVVTERHGHRPRRISSDRRAVGVRLDGQYCAGRSRPGFERDAVRMFLAVFKRSCVAASLNSVA